MAKRNNHLFPRIYDRKQSRTETPLVRLVNELNTIDMEEALKDKMMRRKSDKVHSRVKTEPSRAHDELESYKSELVELKRKLYDQKKEKEISIQNKLNKIQRLTSHGQNPAQSPRSAINYIHVSPPQHFQSSPFYNMYPYPPPPPFYPYPQQYPPYYFSEGNSQHSSRNRISPPTRQSFYERKKSKKLPGRSKYSVLEESLYDSPQKPDRLRKMYETKSSGKTNLRSQIQKNLKKLRKKWRAVGWAIFFSIRLPMYSKKIASIRQSAFNTFSNRKFNTEMTMMQKYIVKKCKPFFLFIANKKQYELTIEDNETSRMDTEKAQIAKKMINLLIEGLNSISVQDKNEPAISPVQLIHIFCKHGGFISNFMTEQQLDMVCFSDKNKYLRSQRNIEKSQIINFLCLKILLFNTILNPSKVDAKLFPIDNQTINKNFYFFGSIWYELCLQVQDQYLYQVPEGYEIGNWRKYRQRYNITPAKSLTANGKAKQQDELISGLLGKKKIDDLFGVNFWRKQKSSLKGAIQNLHLTIVNYHKKLKQGVKF